MVDTNKKTELPVRTTCEGRMMAITLNRPNVLNALNLPMIRMIRESFEMALKTDSCKWVLLEGAGKKAFCAGGDVKALVRWVKEKKFISAEQFFKEEYALDLLIHQFPKPVAAICDGITMGGGLGLAAGADIILVTEDTQVAMPETAIGFFPDVGTTGWLFEKSLKGYPEYLGLTGHVLTGAEAVHCGLATHLVRKEAISDIKAELGPLSDKLSHKKNRAVQALESMVDHYHEEPVAPHSFRDEEIEAHFFGKPSLEKVVDSLRETSPTSSFARETLHALAKRSPTALMLTFALFKTNRGCSLPEVFERDRKAASFMIRHADYLEGVRAQILDKDHTPQWHPKTYHDVGPIERIFN